MPPHAGARTAGRGGLGDDDTYCRHCGHPLTGFGEATKDSHEKE